MGDLSHAKLSQVRAWADVGQISSSRYVDEVERRRAAAEADGRRLVMVCSSCLTASCWQGALKCTAYEEAGSLEYTVAELRQIGLENPDYWEPRRDFSGKPVELWKPAPGFDCAECKGTGRVDCGCRGDVCTCRHNGSAPCQTCGGEGRFGSEGENDD